MEQITRSGAAEVKAGSGPGALREDLLVLLRQKEVRRKMNEALLREATGEAKSTGVIRAYELVQKILQDAGEDVPAEELDLRLFSDSALRGMIERIRREGEGDTFQSGAAAEGVPADTSYSAGMDGGGGYGQPEAH